MCEDEHYEPTAHILILNNITTIITTTTQYLHDVVTTQLRRLVWVLSAPGAHRGALLLAPDAEVDARITASLGEEERRVLSEFGWQAGCGVRTMLNFQGALFGHVLCVAMALKYAACAELLECRGALDP